MAITTSSGDRYDSLENFIGYSPNEYVNMEFNAIYGQTYEKPKIPVGPINTPTQKGDWESEVITNFPPAEYGKPKDTMKNYKKSIEDTRDAQEILDTFGIPPQVEQGRVIRPGESDYIRSKDLGKPVVYAGIKKDVIKLPPLVPTPMPDIDPDKVVPPQDKWGPKPTPPWTKERPFVMNDNKPPLPLDITMPNIAGGLRKPPKPANDNDKRKPW